MNSEDKLPTPYDLMSAPQLAVISVLDRTLEMLALTLLAQHPDLFDHEKPYWIRDDPCCGMAEQVLSNIDKLSSSLQRYRYRLSGPAQPPQIAAGSFRLRLMQSYVRTSLQDTVRPDNVFHHVPFSPLNSLRCEASNSRSILSRRSFRMRFQGTAPSQGAFSSVFQGGPLADESGGTQKRVCSVKFMST